MDAAGIGHRGPGALVDASDMFTPTTISLLKDGVAIPGNGENSGANPVTGTHTIAVPTGTSLAAPASVRDLLWPLLIATLILREPVYLLLQRGSAAGFVDWRQDNKQQKR